MENDWQKITVIQDIKEKSLKLKRLNQNSKGNLPCESFGPL